MMKTGNVFRSVQMAIMAAFLVGTVGIGQTNAQETIYVNVLWGHDSFNGGSSNVGLFPVGPFQTLRRALAEAKSGDTVVVAAGDYVSQGEINPDDKDITFAAHTWRSDTEVLVAGFIADDADRTLTLASERMESGGVFVTDGKEYDLVLTAGTIHIRGSLKIGKGGKIDHKEGKWTGNSPIYE